MHALRNRLFAGSVSVLTLISMLAILVLPADARPNGDRFADRMIRALGDSVDVSDAAYRAAENSPGTLDAYLEAFIAELDAESGSAARLLVGYQMSDAQLVTWLRGHVSNELSPALGSRQAFVASTPTSGDTRQRTRGTAEQTSVDRPVENASDLLGTVDSDPHLIDCGYRCSSVQPLGP